MKYRTWITLLLGAALAAGLLTGCGAASYRDGTYEGQSSVYENEDEDSEEGNGYGVVDITISGGKISSCTFNTYEPDGKLKDEDYGKEGGEIKNKDFYNKAQRARSACENYSQQLVAKGDIGEVDAISGATYNYNQFVEAVDNALAQAEQK